MLVVGGVRSLAALQRLGGQGVSRIERFEDIYAWQRARALASHVYGATNERTVNRDFRFCSQLQAAVVSVMSNIAEGWERDNLAEFSNFLRIAKASCAEARSLLYVASDVGYIDQATFERLLAETDDASRLIHRLRQAVDRRKSAPKPGAPRDGD